MPAHTLSRRTLATGLLATPLLLRQARAQSAVPLRIRLDWTPWGSQAAIHLASAKGWYKNAGLDVTIDDGNGTNQTVQMVGGGDDIDVGHAALSSMMIARDKGFNLRGIACYARNSDIGVMVPVDSGITQIKDLRGKRIGHTASSLETPFINDFLKSGGLTRADIELVNLDGAAKLAAYLSGKLDGAFSSIPFFVPAVQDKRASRGLLLSQAGLHLPSYGLFARDATIAAKKDALTKLVSITDGAWAYIRNGHQDEGVQAILGERPNAKLSGKVMRGQIDSFITFFPTDATKDAPVGNMTEADWAQAVSALKSANLLSKDFNPKDFYTNELFDKALYAKTAGMTA